MRMGYWSLYLIISVSLSFCIVGTSQLQSSQIQVLMQLRKHLEYPDELAVWNDNNANVCFMSPSTKINVTCEVDVVTELRIMGSKPFKVGKFVGYAIPNLTLSDRFSMDSFVATLARLTSLRALSLVSLGIWGPLPDKINRLSSLEFLDLSSNFLYGSVPPRIATMVKLQTLRLDGNFFNESVPDWLHSLSNLSILSLSDNHLKGPFPASIRKIRTLSTLALSNNKISGGLPDLSSLSGLKMLDLSWNELDSELPKLPGALFMALLNNNSFTGEIPQEFRKLNHLQHLDLSLNHLQGRLPTILFSLPNISYLNLASNELSGSLPIHLACGKKLEFADLSNNRLIGEIPWCLNKITAQFYGNCLTAGGVNQHPESYCAKMQQKKNNYSAKSALALVGVIGGIVAVVGLLAFGILVIYRKYCPRGCQEQSLLQKQVQENSVTGVTSEILANARYISEVSKSGTQGIPACRTFSMEELKEATMNFDKSALMGEGARGKMYQGTLQSKTLVAVRCLSLSNKYTTRNLKLRLDLLAKLRHPHLVCLLGHCIDTGAKADSSGNKVYLIYEYVPNGNLRSHLSANAMISDLGQVRALKWPERLVILIDIAKAVQFLHTGIIPGFFNNRLRTNNILIDEHRRAKLSDYGLSIIYDDDEFGGKAAAKSWQMKIIEDDIYCFGFILLESLIGPSVAAKKKAVLLTEMASFGSEEGQRRVIDPIVLSTSSKESLTTVISITNKCVSSESSTRPSFEDVLWNLQYAAQVQATADGDQKIGSMAQP
ncbi:probable inactive leucine-rich repeat receptor-like protein kinase At3g03770 isoform X1 [Chenopodium quinoa]|uniref:probable inactive leucine-rich repeat receptor-like protein kinase At3g03770 isoform X1 n=1 Tax=Chenopodium quinoa TaxID=63459 RepID=UPI000B76D1A4|nr:probable inactive leucine-rich repeat receptor-like protein kinase At3g03770 isoform X1 [Chenopodium quinoa]